MYKKYLFNLQSTSRLLKVGKRDAKKSLFFSFVENREKESSVIKA